VAAAADGFGGWENVLCAHPIFWQFWRHFFSAAARFHMSGDSQHPRIPHITGDATQSVVEVEA